MPPHSGMMRLSPMQQDSTPEGYFQFGYIGRAHGIRGALRIGLLVQYPDDYAHLTQLWLHTRSGLQAAAIVSLQLTGPNEGILQLAGTDTRTAAEALQGMALYLPNSELPPLDTGQFFYHEIIGYTLLDATQGVVGSIGAVLHMPAQDVLEVQHTSGQTVLVPLVDAWQPVLDREAGTLTLHLPAGLVEVYLKAPAADARDED